MIPKQCWYWIKKLGVDLRRGTKDGVYLSLLFCEKRSLYNCASMRVISLNCIQFFEITCWYHEFGYSCILHILSLIPLKCGRFVNNLLQEISRRNNLNGAINMQIVLEAYNTWSDMTGTAYWWIWIPTNNITYHRFPGTIRRN